MTGVWVVKQAKCRSKKIFCCNKRWCAPKNLWGVLGGGGTVITYLLNGLFYFWGLPAAPGDAAGSLPADPVTSFEIYVQNTSTATIRPPPYINRFPY
jgi:hypothetical protein